MCIRDSVTDGRKIIYGRTSQENGFLGMPDDSVKADIIYICSPNNPTGAAYTLSLIHICAPVTAGADGRMRIFNADGSEAQMCGHAAYAVAAHLGLAAVCVENAHPAIGPGAVSYTHLTG